MDVLILFTALAWKHAFADLFLQTLHYSPNKSQYISNAHRHYAEHGLLTVIICMFGLSLSAVLIINKVK